MIRSDLNYVIYPAVLSVLDQLDNVNLPTLHAKPLSLPNAMRRMRMVMILMILTILMMILMMILIMQVCANYLR